MHPEPPPAAPAYVGSKGRERKRPASERQNKDGAIKRRMGVWIDVELFNRLKAAHAASRIPSGKIVEDALIEWLPNVERLASGDWKQTRRRRG